ncbi:hypothetical protein HPB51_012121 [Rhipicephalus microplus]|uniref:DDE Tnp4 domain-containing protein n=1 Tax=Rhipicephalus microplus TaxID=6941 RepID=A0A9J6DUF3_RHIMP|nr:hypothetical protein HPB51_012121 [Rhipicephalus microplus]
MREVEDRTVANMFDLGSSTVNTIYAEFCDIVVEALKYEWVRMLAADEMTHHIREFYAVTGFPQAVGALDGRHFLVSPPRENAIEYYNVKGWGLFGGRASLLEEEDDDLERLTLDNVLGRSPFRAATAAVAAATAAALTRSPRATSSLSRIQHRLNGGGLSSTAARSTSDPMPGCSVLVANLHPHVIRDLFQYIDPVVDATCVRPLSLCAAAWLTSSKYTSCQVKGFEVQHMVPKTQDL